jgi:hypothetical protein
MVSRSSTDSIDAIFIARAASCSRMSSAISPA